MATRKQQSEPKATGRAVHDAKGNSVWKLNETNPEEFRDTQTWVVRALEAPELSIDDDRANSLYVAVDTDPYNRGR